MSSTHDAYHASAWRRVMLLVALSLGACAPQPTSGVTPFPSAPTAGLPRPTILFPKPDTIVQMGKAPGFIVEVGPAGVQPPPATQVTIEILDPSGQVEGLVGTVRGPDGVFRANGWVVPHRKEEGTWRVRATARKGSAESTASTSFEVVASTSETLLEKYGFWIDSPSIQGIPVDLVDERGDSRDGMIRWGGAKPAAHVLPETWIDVHWRTGRFPLADPNQVKLFMFHELGSFGFAPIRQLETFQQVPFKQWQAWLVTARGAFSYDDVQWMVFYAPEVDKTYAIGTWLVLPPIGVDAHGQLRSSFEVAPDAKAQGTAPKALEHLVPAPQLVGPPLGERFVGSASKIILSWQPAQPLAADEYFQVRVDYNYGEGNPQRAFSTRASSFELPASLYANPNCGVFNWQVTVMRQTGTDESGAPEGEAVSYPSLYWYVIWAHPSGQPASFPPRCPNAQF